MFREPGYRIYSDSRVGPHNTKILEILFGSLLGTAQAEKREHGKGTRIKFEQSSIQLSYLWWLHELVSKLGYANRKTPVIKYRLEKGCLLGYITFST